MSSRRFRALGLLLVVLPLVYYIGSSILTYLPSGAYPYTVPEEWTMLFGEILVIFGVYLVMTTEGRWSRIGVFIVALPVVYIGVWQTYFVALPNWAGLSLKDRLLMIGGAAMVAAGLYLQLADSPGRPLSRLFKRSPKAIPPEPDVELAPGQ